MTVGTSAIVRISVYSHILQIYLNDIEIMEILMDRGFSAASEALRTRSKVAKPLSLCAILMRTFNLLIPIRKERTIWCQARSAFLEKADLRLCGGEKYRPSPGETLLVHTNCIGFRPKKFWPESFDKILTFG